MDDATFGLNECQRVFFNAGIRHILRSPDPIVSREISQPVSLVDLPIAYQALFKKNLPGSSTLWTYFELGFDLIGSGSTSRSQYLKQLIQNLAWPKGSICFWPFTIFEKNLLKPCPELFLFGLQKFAPQGIVVFGKDSFCKNLFIHESVYSYVNSESIPFLWLDDLDSHEENPKANPITIDELQTFKKGLL